MAHGRQAAGNGKLCGQKPAQSTASLSSKNLVVILSWGWRISSRRSRTCCCCTYHQHLPSTHLRQLDCGQCTGSGVNGRMMVRGVDSARPPLLLDVHSVPAPEGGASIVPCAGYTSLCSNCLAQLCFRARKHTTCRNTMPRGRYQANRATKRGSLARYQLEWVLTSVVAYMRLR